MFQKSSQKNQQRPVPILLIIVALASQLAGCGNDAPLTAQRYEQSDALFSQLEANLATNPSLQSISVIDHSRLGSEVGSEMPPAKVLIFSNPALEARLMEQNPLVAIDLPLRVLAFETEPGADSKVIYNSLSYLESRYELSASPEIEEEFEETMAQVLNGISAKQIAFFEQDDMQPDGIITIDSPFDFQTTIEKVQAAIDSQDDTVGFGSVDFKERASEAGVSIGPATLILFGAPGPGAKAMSKAPTLGLDAFCQKFLIWQDKNDQVHLSFNDLLDVAERQGVGKPLPLRVINYRLNSVFEEALASDQ